MIFFFQDDYNDYSFLWNYSLIFIFELTEDVWYQITVNFAKFSKLWDIIRNFCQKYSLLIFILFHCLFFLLFYFILFFCSFSFSLFVPFRSLFSIHSFLKNQSFHTFSSSNFRSRSRSVLVHIQVEGTRVADFECFLRFWILLQFNQVHAGKISNWLVALVESSPEGR